MDEGYGFSSSHVCVWELEHQEGWAPDNPRFRIVVLEKSPLDCKETNQSILKEINPEYLLEGLMMKLKFQYFDHLRQRADSLEKTLMLGKTEAGGERDDKGWDGWMASPTQRTWVWVGSKSWWWTGRPGVLGFMELQRVRRNWVNELNWTDKVTE